MALHKLVFDATDSDTRSASANVGAYLRSFDGTLLTHTDVGGKKALDVRIAEGINVEVDLAAADDSVSAWLKDGSGTSINSTSNALNSFITNASLTVTATNLDIRDLVFATDKVDASGSEVSLSAGTLAALETINIGNTVSVTDATYTTLKNIAETVGVAAAAIVAGANELVNRRKLYVYNNGNKMMYIGESGITTATGFPLPPGSILDILAGPAMDIFAIADAANQNMRTLQIA